MRATILALCLTVSVSGFGEAPDGGSVRATLDAQVAAWNRGDLAGYMNGYWKSPELTFFANAAVTRGWQATLDRYRARYAAPGRQMGTLRFEDLQIVPFSPDAAMARGTFVLQLPEGERRGLFTVLFRRLPEGWRIVHDHSSM